MKYIPNAFLPALALLTLGSCAGTSGLTTTEPDGVYYSSKDRTVAVASTAPASSPDDPNAVANPEYREDRRRTRGSASDEYYDEDYAYSARIRRFHRPSYRGLGMGYYDYAFVDPFWYNPTMAFYGYDPFFDPFWGPSFYGGSFVSFNMGFGRGAWGPWGPYGGFGAYRPWGFGGGYYNGFYDGYYSGLYGNGWGGWGGNNAWNGYRQGSRNVNYGPRRDRAVEVVGSRDNGNGSSRPRVNESTGGRAASTAAPVRYRGRVEDVPTGGVAADPSGGRVSRTDETAETQDARKGRGRMYRILDSEVSPASASEAGVTRQPGAASQYEQPAETYGNRRRARVDSDQPAQQNSEPQYSRPRRERAAEYSAPEQVEQPVRRQRVYEAPAPTRSYEAPQRSYEAPSRSYDRSSSGSNSGSSGGGGRRGRVE